MPVLAIFAELDHSCPVQIKNCCGDAMAFLAPTSRSEYNRHYRAKGERMIDHTNLEDYTDPALYDLENRDFEPDGPFYLTLAQELGGEVRLD